MKSTFGQSVTLTIAGESHGEAITAILAGIAPGVPVDKDYIASQMQKRQAVGDISTPRHEADEVEILSGVFDGVTTGTPITLLIRNQNTRSQDYKAMSTVARPGHADYTAQCKYHGYQDYRGGGHFSGRITAALVAAGAIALTALARRDIRIATHIARCGGVSDRPFGDLTADMAQLNNSTFAVLDTQAGEQMQAAIRAAKADGDSVGGVLETVVTGLPAGVGEPWFDSVESVLAHILYAIPAVKGVEFGDGFKLSDMRGSEANDGFAVVDGQIRPTGDHNGGINGGITNGGTLRFSCGIKPTPTIHKPQQTVDFAAKEPCELQAGGRHDPCIVHRARVVVDSAAALALCDLLALRFGTDCLGG